MMTVVKVNCYLNDDPVSCKLLAASCKLILRCDDDPVFLSKPQSTRRTEKKTSQFLLAACS
jgi:hypothetical protein